MGHKGRTISCTADYTALGADRDTKSAEKRRNRNTRPGAGCRRRGGPPNRGPGNRAALRAGDGPEHTP